MLALDDCEEELGPSLVRGVVRFGGIKFRLTGDLEACGRMARVGEPRAACVTLADTLGPKFAAGCRLVLLPMPRGAAEGPPRITWEWGREQGELRTRFGGARIRQENGGWVARAWLAPAPPAASFVLSGLCAMLVHRQGGVLLHAASVVLGGSRPGVLAFVGPSGAGKSTACGLVQGAAMFSLDRLAVLPSRTARLEGAAAAAATPWLSHPLPGGTASVGDMPSTAPRWLPLLGILRVVQHRGTSFVAPCSGASGVAALRESAFQAGVGPGAESELLATLDALGGAVPVGRLHQSLGFGSEPLLRGWLRDQARG